MPSEPLSQDFNLAGKVAIVTGATKGMGLAIARRFAAAGALVSLCSRSAEEAGEVADDLNARHGNGGIIAIARRCDVEVKAELQALVDATVAEWGTVTTLVCNASRRCWLGPMAEIPDSEMDLSFLTLFKSKFWLSHMAIPHMVKAGGGSIVFISSGSAFESPTERAVHSAIRAAEVHLMKTMAVAYGPDNIRVNSIPPGLIRTFSSEGLIASLAEAGTLGANIPLRRAGEGDEIARAALFLASDASSFTTGVILPVDGGRLLHADTAGRLTKAFGAGGGS